MDETISVIREPASADGRCLIEFDAIFIGARVSGFALYHLHRFGLKMQLFEEGGDCDTE